MNVGASRLAAQRESRRRSTAVKAACRECPGIRGAGQSLAALIEHANLRRGVELSWPRAGTTVLGTIMIQQRRGDIHPRDAA